MSDLLSDLQDEHHLDLLANGNMRGDKTRESRWTGEKSWTSLGYVARLTLSTCNCGHTTPWLMGVFHREQAPNGSIKEQRLDERFQVPLGGAYPIETTQQYTVSCAYCITSKGFSHV